MHATRTYLGWEAVMGGIEEMGLTTHQIKQAKSRRDESDFSVASLMGQTYIHALVPEQPKSHETPQYGQWRNAKVRKRGLLSEHQRSSHGLAS